jgi:FkbM family methyltransferase
VPLTEHPRFELIPHSTTGDFCCRKAIELGYREIYLIGIEGQYVEEITGSRPMSNDEYDELGLEQLRLSKNHRRTLRIITDTPEDNPNYFFYGYQRAGDIYSLPQSGVHRRGWNETAEVVESAGVKVLNLSEVSSVDNFPRSTLSGFLGDDSDAQSSYWYGPFDRDIDKRIEEAGMVLDLVMRGSLAVGDVPLMVDVGACKGTAFGEFAKQNWTVHAFEPNPPVFDNLVEKFNTPNVTINRLAVSDVASEDVPFYTSDESLGISSLKPFRPTHEETARVETVTLDDYLDEAGVARIDFLKIDTEGFDLMVLKGLDLTGHEVETILCEFEDRKTQPLGYAVPDMADYLESFGYTVYVSGWHPVVQYGDRISGVR